MCTVMEGRTERENVILSLNGGGLWPVEHQANIFYFYEFFILSNILPILYLEELENLF